MLAEYFPATGIRLGIAVPLSVACLAILVVVPMAAAHSRLHIPGYAGLAFLAAVVGFLCGRISGTRGVSGTAWGVLLSLGFFLSLAFSAGSVLALLFYRDPPQT